jgi:LuxR family maltose regulon positive regulatory protein
VSRARLIEQLNQGVGCKLILVSATAGFGKTTLLSEWLRQAKIPISWLSLDEGENESSRFWIYFVTALQQSHRKVGESTLAMLRSAEPTSFESFLVPLINELANLQEDSALVLDDYHLITAPPIHQALTFLLEHLPPQLHLAIASRVDPPLPLARLRARAQLIELRAADLRFTNAEATTFLNQLMQLPLSEDQIEAIQSRTEGWVAGLQLAALSMRDAADISTVIESFKGSQRYILDYLVEEVLERQPQPLQSFLLQTSILEQMCGSLCEAVVGDNCSINGTETLEQLERRNLFLVPLDHERHWYRYHHLFQELLRHYLHRTEPEQVPEYHRRAAQWYKQHQFIAEAAQQAIAAQEFHWAADLIEQEVPATDNSPIESATLLRLLEALPRELVWNRPWLLLAYAWALLSSSQFEAAVAAVQSLECLMKQQQDSPSANTEKLWGLVTAFKGVQARHQGEAPEAIALMEQALRLLSQDDSWLRPMILLNLGVTYFVADNFELAKPVLREVTRIGQTKGIADPAIAGLYLQAQFQALRGRIDPAIALCQQGFEVAKERNWLTTYAGVLVQVALGELLREQNQLVAAAQHLTESIERGTQIRQPGVMMGYITLARVHQAQGDTQAAWEAIRAAEQLPTWLWPTILSLEACKTRLYLAQGNLEAAIAWAEESGLGVEDELRYSFTDRHPQGSELDYLTLARVLIARGRVAETSEPYLDDAMQLLIRLHEFAKAGGRKTRVMEVLILQALVWQARGDLEQALSLLEQALHIPREGGYIRLFIDEGQPMEKLVRHAASRGICPNYVSRLLAAFGPVEREVSAKVQPLIEPLSERELEILRYLATGLSNQAIADKLIVSLATVKWHARNIYGKLNVSNRTQAVARARELRILG